MARSSKVDPDPELQNHYQEGAFVLYDKYLGGFRPSKLTPKYEGPYVVLSRHKADYDCKHVAMGNIVTLHMDRLKPFFGTKEEALEMAMLDPSWHIAGTH